MMNKKGNIFLSVTLAIFIFIMFVMIIPFFTDDITQVRTDLDCTNSSISDGSKIQCLQQDVVVPFWIILGLSVFIGFVIGGKV